MKETKDCEGLEPCARFGEWSPWGSCMKHAVEDRFLRSILKCALIVLINITKIPSFVWLSTYWKSFQRKRERTCISGALEQFYCPESDRTEFGPCECIPPPTKTANLKTTASFKVADMPQTIQDALQTLIDTGDSVGESDMDPAVLEQLRAYLGT